MDPVLNSLVQSPLVRSLSSIPTKTSSFVHGVRDNIPPFSREKVVVVPYTKPVSGQVGTHKFRIPQVGILDRAYLRIAMKNQYVDMTNPQKVHPIAYVSGGFEPGEGLKTKKARVPWFHHCQTEPGTGTEEQPFGSGGASVVLNDSRLGGTYNEGGAVSNLLMDPTQMTGNASNSWNAIKCLTELSLKSRNKTVETLPADCIAAEVMRMPRALREMYEQGMVGWSAGNKLSAAYESSYTLPFDPSACSRNFRGIYRLRTSGVVYNGSHLLTPLEDTTDSYFDDNGLQHDLDYCSNFHADFIVPLPFSTLGGMHKNMQTRFVEEMELHVGTRDYGDNDSGYNTLDEDVQTDGAPAQSYELELVLIYHNWHDNIENSIRQSNYKSGVPASLYGTNWYSDVAGTIVNSSTSAKGRATFNLTCRNLATSIFVVAKRLKHFGNLYGDYKGSEYCPNRDGKDLVYRVTLTGSGKTIWEGTTRELAGPDGSDYDLTERKVDMDGFPRSSRVADRRIQYPLRWAVDKARNVEKDKLMRTQAGIEYGFGQTGFALNFGLQTHDEFYSGGIALQTISNPVLTIETLGSELAQDEWTNRMRKEEMEFQVYVKYANIVRVDSDTGVITRTLDV